MEQVQELNMELQMMIDRLDDIYAAVVSLTTAQDTTNRLLERIADHTQS